jgi:SAM-dependent methyltransferase
MEYLFALAASGGPEVHEYPRVDTAFRLIMNALRVGRITREQIRETWVSMGEAFGPDTMQGHGIRKPYGYAGDFEMIDRIYQYSLTANPRTRRWDEYFQSRGACEAVRNRKEYFLKLLASERRRLGDEFRVLNVGSGPARDVLEFFHGPGSGSEITFDCVDMDANAIEYARSLCVGVANQVAFHRANIFKWRTSASYELVWSAGLFDYLDDNAFVALIRHMSSFLSKSGRLVIGNFSPENPTRDYMEFGEWNLKHRSKEELLHLAESCALQGFDHWIEEEPRKINLFLNLQKVSE